MNLKTVILNLSAEAERRQARFRIPKLYQNLLSVDSEHPSARYGYPGSKPGMTYFVSQYLILTTYYSVLKTQKRYFSFTPKFSPFRSISSVVTWLSLLNCRSWSKLPMI